MREGGVVKGICVAEIQKDEYIYRTNPFST